jgi:hypothetical protein
VQAGEVDEVYQDDDLSSSFNIDPNSALESLLGDANDVTVLEEKEQQIRKKKFLIFDITFLIFHINFLCLF